MTHEITGLAASYRRRAWCARFTGAVMAANLMLTLAPSNAQDGGAQVAQNTTDKSGKTTTPAKTDGKTKPASGKTAPSKTPAKSAATSKSASKSAPAAASGTAAGGGMSIVPMQGGGTPGGAPAGTPGQATGGQGGNAQPGGNGSGGRGGRGFGGGGFGGGGGGLQGMGRGAAAGTTFSFDFHGTDIDNVLKFYATMSQLNIVKDPGLTGSVTIICPQQITLDEAFKILQAELYIRGFTAVQNDRVLSILPFKGAKTTTRILNPGINEEGNTQVDARNQFMTQVIPIENADAEALARELKELASPDASLIGSPGTNSLIITDTASNIARFITLVEALDKSSNKSDLKIYSLQRADASNIAQLINDLYSKTTTRGRGGAGAPQPGQPGFNPGQPGQPQQGASTRPAVVAVADPSTNSVLVVASPTTQEEIARDFIGRLDGDDSNRLETTTRKINFSDAQTVADLVNSVLSNQRPGGTGSTNPSFQQRAFGGGGFGGFFGGFGGGGGQQAGGTQSTDPFGKVVADPRTNTLLITASKDRLVRINDLIDKLDQEVPTTPTTFVIPLKNAQAQDVSYALGQAFGTSSSGLGNNNSFFSFGGGNSSSSSNSPFNRQGNSQRRLGSSSSSSPFGRGARAQNNIPPGPPPSPDQNGGTYDPSVQSNGGSAQPQGVQGVMTDQGFVPNEAPSDPRGGNGITRQGFFGGGFGRQQQGLGQSNSPQYGRGLNGSYSNLLRLQNNVFVTPAPGGDSIIVTTLPENFAAVQQIVEALDIVPRQVMIEVIVAEVTLSDDQKLGFSLNGNFARLFGKTNTGQAQVNAQSGSSGTAFDPLAQGAQFVLNGTNYSALLQALTTDDKAKVLATPRIFASNNQEADISIAQQIPYANASITGGLSTLVQYTTTFAPVGLLLQVTPRITRQGLVTIDVSQEADDLLRFQQVGTGPGAQTVPVINQRITDTEVTIQDGQTVVIGGLIRNNSALNITKIPVLSDIPLIGQFFRSREVTHDRTELMIFLTPHVVNNVDEARALTLQQGAPVIRAIPDLSAQQPNLTLPKPPNGTKVDPKTLPHDSAGRPYYPGPNPSDTNAGKNNGTGTGTGTGTGNGSSSGSGTGGTTGSGTSGGTTGGTSSGGTSGGTSNPK